MVADYVHDAHLTQRQQQQVSSLVACIVQILSTIRIAQKHSPTIVASYMLDTANKTLIQSNNMMPLPHNIIRRERQLYGAKAPDSLPQLDSRLQMKGFLVKMPVTFVGLVLNFCNQCRRTTHQNGHSGPNSRRSVQINERQI